MVTELNKSKTKPKVVSVSAVFEDPKLSKLMNDAMNAPIGSSKREKASSVLRSLSMSGGGMGGNSLDQLPMYPENSLYQTSPYGTNTPTGGQQSETLQSKPQSVSSMGQSKSQFQDVPPGESVEPQQGYPRFMWPSMSQPKEPIRSEDVMSIPPGDDIVDEEIDIDKENIDTESKNMVINNLPPMDINDVFTVEGWYSDLGPEEKKQWAPLYDAWSQGLGAETFAYDLRNDKEKLKALFPDVPEDQLPLGASLARQIDTLSDQLKEEYGVNSKLDRLQTLQERGLTIENDLTNFVRERDQYINRLDDMIMDAKESMLTMDLGNPYTKQWADNYLNYLTTLKGRQTQRYSDFLSDGIAYHNAELKQAENNYNNTVDAFNTELTTKAEITKEDFNNMNTMLENMYTNLDGREERELTKFGIRLAQNQEWLDYINTMNNGSFRDVYPNDQAMAKERLEGARGDNNKVPLDKWLELKDEWDNKFGPGYFEDYFPAREYLDITDPNVQPYVLTPGQRLNPPDSSSGPSMQETLIDIITQDMTAEEKEEWLKDQEDKEKTEGTALGV